MFASTNVHGVRSVQVNRHRLASGANLIDIVLETESGSFTLTAFSVSRLALTDDTRTDAQLDDVRRGFDERHPTPEGEIA